jgi:hypothetical protein
MTPRTPSGRDREGIRQTGAAARRPKAVGELRSANARSSPQQHHAARALETQVRDIVENDIGGSIVSGLPVLRGRQACVPAAARSNQARRRITARLDRDIFDCADFFLL